ncbi:amino acid permease [Endozoicomonas sp.]|uniref:amino acid permease n=1 Tax=Endozoicomonas sp. TaxID=1892382 RepID=UPI002885D2EE|nr:aromatic amino acid transport family protein [Endozoicomonas sp.]
MSESSRSSLIGSALILAGTAIGAGMLALPLVSASTGLIPVIILFLVTAFFAVISALYAFEANVAIKPGCNLYTMASRTLGRMGKVLSAIAPLGLFYALMSAYFSGGGSLLAQFVQVAIPEASSQLCVILFALIAGVFVYYSTRAVDLVNRVFFSMMVVAFILVLISLAPSVRYESMVHTENVEYLSLMAALPVVFTSFGYHGGIPSIIIYQKKQLEHIPRIFLVATLIPLTVYTLWLIAVMGVLPEAALWEISKSSGATARLIAALSSDDDIHTILYLFSDLALLTSVLGVSLGLFDYLANLLQRADTRIHRFQTALVTFIPPVIFAIMFPDGFVAALGYAAIALAILAILLPTSMVYVLRKKTEYKNSFRAPGGKIMMSVCFLFGCIVILSQLISRL